MSGTSDYIPDYVAVGKIVRARGISGELAVIPLTDFPDRFGQLDNIFLERADSGDMIEYRISSVRNIKSQIILKLDGVNNRDDAESLVGSFLCVGKDQVVELPEGSFYQFEIEGMAVVTDDGKPLGEVAEIMQFPANDVWRVEGTQEFLLPAIKDVVLHVDRKKRVVTVHLIAGLIEEKKTSKKSKK